MCRALSIVGSYAKCQFAGDFGVTVGHNEHSLHNPYTQIDAVKCQSNAKGMHFLEIVGLLRTPQTLQQTYPRLLSRSNFMRTQNPICAGVNMIISKLIPRSGDSYTRHFNLAQEIG